MAGTVLKVIQQVIKKIKPKKKFSKIAVVNTVSSPSV